MLFRIITDGARALTTSDSKGHLSANTQSIVTSGSDPIRQKASALRRGRPATSQSFDRNTGSRVDEHRRVLRST
jgi:hypothetical protein